MAKSTDNDFLNNFNTFNKINLYFFPFSLLHLAIKEVQSLKAYYFLAKPLFYQRILYKMLKIILSLAKIVFV